MRQPIAWRCEMRNLCVSLTLPPYMIRRGGELGVVFFRHATEPTSTLAKILYVVLRRHTHVAAVLCWRAAEGICALLSKRNSGLVSVTHASHCSEWRAHRYLLATPRPAVRVHARQRGVHRACAAPPTPGLGKKKTTIETFIILSLSNILLLFLLSVTRLESAKHPRPRNIEPYCSSLWSLSGAVRVVLASPPQATPTPTRKAHALTHIFFPPPQILTFLQSSHLVPILLQFEFSFHPPAPSCVIIFQWERLCS